MRTTQKPTPAISRQAPKQRSSWQYYTAATICCAALVAGFFFAARQHFSSMEYGLQNSRLRRQLDELQAEKRRLLLNREVSLSPNELKKAIHRVGFIDDTDSIKTAQAKTDVTAAPKSVAKTVEVSAPATSKPANKVLRTVITAPVNKPAPIGKQARRDSPSTKKDRT
jgi:hypothetical protein